MIGDFVDNAYKTGAGRYLQECNGLSKLADEVAILGSKAYVMGGPHSLPIVRERMEASLLEASIPFTEHVFDGPPTRNTAARMGNEAHREECDVIVGVGGGRMMDAAKAVAYSAQLPLIQVPTSMATCAAYSPISVMYTEAGGHDGVWRFTREIDAVIVDMNVMASQPPRLIAAGVLDSMAKVFEIENGGTGISCETESVDRFAAYEYAKVNFGLLTSFGKQAYDDASNNKVTQALEKVAFTNIALTGVVSSLTRGFHQTALAHKLYDGARTVFGTEAAPWLHGELVAIGLIMQLIYNGQPERVPWLREFMRSMSMPCSLGEVGIFADDPRFNDLYEYVALSEFVERKERCALRVEAAFQAIE